MGEILEVSHQGAWTEKFSHRNCIYTVFNGIVIMHCGLNEMHNLLIYREMIEFLNRRLLMFGVRIDLFMISFHDFIQL